MKILDRYILRAFFTNYLIALSVMIGLYILLDLFVNLDEFTAVQSDSRMETFVKIIDYYGYNLFLYFAQLAGVILLVAACCTLARLHRNNELTAILASGTSLHRVAAPVVLASLAMNGLWFVDQEFIIPHFADKLSRKHGDIEGRHSFAVWFQADRDNALVSATQFHPRAREMRGVLIMKRDQNLRMTEIIRAERAPWDEERGVWHLERGSLVRFAGESTPGAVDQPAISSEELGGVPVTEYASDLTPKELALQQATLWTHFLSLPDIERLQERFAATGSTEFIKLKHRRLTVVLVNMILLCLGIPFFLNRERPSVIVIGGQCLGVCSLCYVLTFICQNLDLTGLGVNPALPAWLPVVIFGPVAVLFMDNIKT